MMDSERSAAESASTAFMQMQMVMPFQSSQPSTLHTSMSPLQTPISPIQNPMSPLQTSASPFHTQMSPLHPQVSPLRTQMSPLYTQMSPIPPMISPIPSMISPLQTPISPLQMPVSPLRNLGQHMPSAMSHMPGISSFQNDQMYGSHLTLDGVCTPYFSPPAQYHPSFQPQTQRHLASADPLPRSAPSNPASVFGHAPTIVNHENASQMSCVQIEPYFTPLVVQQRSVEEQPSYSQQQQQQHHYKQPQQQQHHHHHHHHQQLEQQQLQQQQQHQQPQQQEHHQQPQQQQHQQEQLLQRSHLWRCRDCPFVSSFRGNLSKHCTNFGHFAETKEDITPDFCQVFSDNRNQQEQQQQHHYPQQPSKELHAKPQTVPPPLPLNKLSSTIFQEQSTLQRTTQHYDSQAAFQESSHHLSSSASGSSEINCAEILRIEDSLDSSSTSEAEAEDEELSRVASEEVDAADAGVADAGRAASEKHHGNQLTFKEGENDKWRHDEDFELWNEEQRSDKPQQSIFSAISIPEQDEPCRKRLKTSTLKKKNKAQIKMNLSQNSDISDSWSPPIIIPSSPTNQGMRSDLDKTSESGVNGSPVYMNMNPEKCRVKDETNDVNESFLHGPLDEEPVVKKEKNVVLKEFGHDPGTTEVLHGEAKDSLTCDQCDFTTEFLKSFKRHKYFHQHKSKRSCKLCSYSVDKATLLKAHIDHHHKKGKEGHKRKKKKKSVKTEGSVKSDKFGSKPLATALPQKTGSLYHESWNNIPTNQPTSELKEESLANPPSHVSFEIIRRDYVERTSLGTKCKVCGLPFKEKNLTNFREHVYAKHLKVKPNKCMYCSYESSYSTSIKRHQVKCQLRNFGIKTEAVAEADSPSKSTLKSGTENRLMQCSYCKFKTKNLNSFNKHAAKHESQLAGIKTHTEEDVISTECEEDDIPLTHLKNQQIIDSLDFLSYGQRQPDDLRSFAQPEDVVSDDVINVYIVKEPIEDINDEHWSEGYYKCDECDYKTKLQQQFRRHQKCHKMQNRHKCDHCSYSAIFPHLVRIHKHHHHKRSGREAESSKEVSKFSCEICNFKTSYSSILDSHKENHEKTSAHKCYICSFSANQPYIVKRHEKKDHTNVERANVSSTPPNKSLKVTRQVHKQAELQEQLRLLDEKQQQLQRNMTSEPATEISTLPSPTKNYKCQECNFSSVLEQELSRHSIHHNSLSSNSNYHCNKCSFTCDTKNLIQLHCDHHHLDCNEGYTELNIDQESSMLLTCKECHFTTEDNTAFKLHLSRHGSTWKWKCSRCNFAAPLESSILEHEKLHHDYISSECQGLNKCHLCDFACDQKESMDEHSRNHVQDHPNKCPLCSFSVIAAADMLSHFKNDHEENQNLSEPGAMKKFNKCVRDKRKSEPTNEAPSIANDEAPVPSRLIKGKRIRQKGLSCKHCSFTTDKNNRLMTHMNHHSMKKGSFKFSCNICNYSGIKRFVIEMHIQNYHKDQDIADLNKLVSSIGEVEGTTSKTPIASGKMPSTDGKMSVADGLKWKCEECSFTTRFMDYIRNHQMRHSVASKYKCCLCSYSAGGKKIVSTHQTRHHSKASFEKCKEPFIIENKVVQRERKVVDPDDKFAGGSLIPDNQPKAEIPHDKEKSNRCTKCRFVASNPAQKKQHMLCHTQKSAFTCGGCKYSVKSASLLKLHKMHHHKNLYKQNGAGKVHKYKCHKCDFTAHRKDLLDSHDKRHGSNSRFNCIYCDYSAFQLSFVENHQSKFHSRSKGAVKVDPAQPTTLIKQEETETELFSINQTRSEEPSVEIKESLSRDLQPHLPRKFNCDECNFSSNQRSNFRAHKARHFRDPSSQAFISCSLCSYCGKNQNALSRHLAAHHGVAADQHGELGQSSIPMTPDSSERSGSEASHLFPITLSSRTNEDQASIQHKIVSGSFQQESGKSIAESTPLPLPDYHGSVLHQIPSTFASSLFPQTNPLSSDVEAAKERVKEALKRGGSFLPSKSQPKNFVLCRFCPCICNNTNERTAHERSHGVRTGSAKLDAQYQCPLCSFASDVDIDAHLGLHLRLAEFHDHWGNAPTTSSEIPTTHLDVPPKSSNVPTLTLTDVCQSRGCDKSDLEKIHLPVNADDAEESQIPEQPPVSLDQEQRILDTDPQTKDSDVVKKESQDAETEVNSSCSHCGIDLSNQDRELHVLRHQLGSQYLLM